MAARTSIHGAWSSRWAFILAATGSAVGLGNIWKFPYITGENGGGAFVIVYLFCIAIIGVPIMMAEIMLGRRGRQSPINTMQTLAIESGHHPGWKFLGILGVLAGFLILSYYSVVAGWSLAYIFSAGSGAFTGQTPDEIGGIFDSLLGNPTVLLGWHTLFMVMTVVVVARGVKNGLETAVKFLMPALLILLLILVGYAINTDGFSTAVSFLFNFDFTEMGWGSVLTAIGHAFFTLSLGMGAIMIYGAYLPKNVSIARTTLAIVAADTLVALLACLVVFPLAFENGLEVGKGPGLVFVTMPLAFGKMEGGAFFGTLFFILLTFAAWTSAISLLEPVVTWMVENKGLKRVKAALIAGVITWGVGVLTVFSFQKDSPIIFSFKFAGTKKSNGIFDILDILTANIMLPVGGIMIALFAGWVMSREASRDELEMGDGYLYATWQVLVRFVAPALIVIVILKLVGLLDPVMGLFTPIIDLFRS